jgi:hypothetical protein
MTKDDNAPPGELILYASEDGQARIQVRMAGQTLWLTQAQIAELFGKDARTVNEHLGNIFAEGELDATATIRKFRILRGEGTRKVERLIDHHNLDAVLAVGYRVRSARGTQFRQWATRAWTPTPPAWTTIRRLRRRSGSSPRSRTRCTGRCTDTRQPRW